MHNIPEDRTTMLMSPGSQASMTLLLEDVLMNFHITKRWTELQTFKVDYRAFPCNSGEPKIL